MDTMDTLDTAKYARIVGVFRDRAKADQAVESLKQAGMSDVELMVYDPQAAGVVETSVDTSAVETATRLATASWRKGGREQDAVGLLADCGANNADLPPGTLLVHGSIVRADEDSAHRVAEKSTGNTPPESFFGTAKAPGHANAISMMDHPDAPHG